jgi:hypothetical protein
MRKMLCSDKLFRIIVAEARKAIYLALGLSLDEAQDPGRLVHSHRGI